MSDATSPPPRSSSTAPASEARNNSDSSSGECEFDSSLEKTTTAAGREEASGDSEGRTDGKQKRKRTSPKDQAILEAEYKLNPKPNKAARAEIVEKVSLNEKEVQIWFQNRRQINRRKSRPLLPHEIAAFGLGGMAALSSDPASMVMFSSSQAIGEQTRPSSQPEASTGQEEEGSYQDEVKILQSEVTVEPAAPANTHVVEPTSDDRPDSQPPTLTRQMSSPLPANNGSSFSVSNDVATSFSSTPGYLANRWNSSFSTPTISQAATFGTPPISNTNQPASCPEKIDETASTPASRIRLSLSLDGKAELVSTSPSPPRLSSERPTSSGSLIPQKRMRTLHRSQSALPFPSRSFMGQAHTPSVPRLPTGRSRDTRTWQFCCDGEVRDELTTQAENESSGSAVAAISLIRSTSSAALKSNANKRNAPAVKNDSTKQPGKRAKLGRAMSSLARLQNPSKSPEKPEKDSFGKDNLMRSPSGDSDKENWLPNENGATSRRRPLPSSRPDRPSHSRSVLGENHKIPAHALNFGGNRNRKRKSTVSHEIFEDEENSGDVGEEVEKFMRGEISPSKKGDLDGVQALLSLSQGNWR